MEEGILSKALEEARRENEQRLFERLTNAAKQENDLVNHPSHYIFGGLETIKVIKAFLGPTRYIGYLWGNLIKYISRWKKKNGVQDLKKARWYLDALIEEIENPTPVGDIDDYDEIVELWADDEIVNVIGKHAKDVTED